MKRLALFFSQREGIIPSQLINLDCNTFSEESKEEDRLTKIYDTLTKGVRNIRRSCERRKGIRKKLYYAYVWTLTEQQDIKGLSNSDKRGWKNYHLDHIMPIDYGFRNHILPSEIADITNLQFIPYLDNLRKNRSYSK